MAFAAVISLAQTINRMLHHDRSRVFLRDHIEPCELLHKNIIYLQSFLEDFPQESSKLEGRIRNVAYEAEDIIENYICSETRGDYTKKLAKDLQNATITCHQRDWSIDLRPHAVKFHQDLQNMKEKIDQLLEEIRKIRAKPQIENAQPILGDSQALVSSHLEDLVVGFEDDLMEIKEQLCGQSSKRQVIPIVGMGGIGKTTLARYAYNDQLAIDHFDFRAWVTISQEYQVHEILLVLLSIEGLIENNVELLIERLYKSLIGKRYLIVLDDIWDTDAWDEIRRALPDDNNGSRVVLTTRISEVASYIDSFAPIHQMPLLDDDQSWSLLQKKVFGHESCPPELEKAGRRISRNCKGLPLAIAVIAGILSSERTIYHWSKVSDNINLAISNNGDEFSELLALSYKHLPPYLKSCFLYMGGFPEDHNISVSMLIRLWVAEGFVKANESKSLELVAEEYLEDLVRRSLVSIVTFKSSGRIKYCTIHDILRDVCVRKAQEEQFSKHLKLDYCWDNFQEESKKYQRRVSVYSYKLDGLKNISNSSIRTALFFRPDIRAMSYISRFRLLRVLDALRITFDKFPSDIAQLIFLRYLALTFFYKGIFVLPRLISELWNLETLIIGSNRGWMPSKDRISLPNEIWRMPQLRHLVFFDHILFPSPSSCGQDFLLQNLQTLSKVTNFICSIEILKMIPNVKKIGLKYYKFSQQWARVGLKNLSQLPLLEKLYFSVDPSSASLNPNDLLENISFPKTIKRLTLFGCRLPWKNMTIVGSLPCLEVLKLRAEAFYGEEWETSEGEFCRLKVLDMRGIMILRRWIAESNYFPCLECLHIYSCPNLEEIPNEIGDIPTLQLIKLKCCRESVGDSARFIQEEQRSFGNDSLHVHISNPLRIRSMP